MQKDVACRKQLPVKLSFALTVHKAQGLTLDRVEIDCRNMWQPGQVGVAVGRATKKIGLRIMNFRPAQIAPHPDIMSDFEMKSSVRPISDLSCCKAIYHHNDLTQDDPTTNSITEIGSESEDDCALLEAIEALEGVTPVVTPVMHQEGRGQLGDLFDVEGHVQQIIDSTSASARGYNELISALGHMLMYKDRMDHFCNITWNSLHENLKGERMTNKDTNRFYADTYAFSSHCQSAINTLFEDQVMTPQHHNAAQLIIARIRKLVINDAACEVKNRAEVSADNRPATATSAAGRGTIRHIGAWCIASLIHELKQYVTNNMYSVACQEKVNETGVMIDGLLRLKAQPWELEFVSEDPESLQETQRRQNLTNSLTNITDYAFKFFMDLDKKIRSFENVSSLEATGEKFYVNIQECITKDDELVSKWNMLMCFSPVSGQILKRVIQKFVRMSCAQFRKDYIHHLRLEKEDAHRKQIQKSSSTSSTSSRVWNFTRILSDTSTKKRASHHRLIFELDTNVNIDKMFSKDALVKLNLAYGLKVLSKDTKKSLVAALQRVTPTLSGFTHPEHLTEHDMPQPPTKRSHIEFPCGVCGKDCKTGTIACDECETWFHGKCVQVKVSHVSDNDTWKCSGCR